MIRHTIFVSLVEVTSAFLNALQDRALGIRGATLGNDVTGMAQDVYSVVWQAKNGITSGSAPVTIDDSIDWRDRFCEGACVFAAALSELPGGASDTSFNARARTHAVNGYFDGWTSTGGYSAVAGAGTPVGAGTPPVDGAAGVRSTYFQLEKGGTDLRMFADPTTGALCLYNNSGGTVFPFIKVTCTGKTGKRP
jgi:hypothetical protein